MPLIGTSLGRAITGIEINKTLVELARRSVEYNHKQDVVNYVMWRLSAYDISDIQDKPLMVLLLIPTFMFRKRCKAYI